jgi:hypothetical protein
MIDHAGHDVGWIALIGHGTFVSHVASLAADRVWAEREIEADAPSRASNVPAMTVFVTVRRARLRARAVGMASPVAPVG